MSERRSALEVGRECPNCQEEEPDEVRPIETELCTEEEARQKFEDFFERCERGGGANLRVELVTGITGVRFTLVCDWGDMG